MSINELQEMYIQLEEKMDEVLGIEIRHFYLVGYNYHHLLGVVLTTWDVTNSTGRLIGTANVEWDMISETAYVSFTAGD